MKTPEEIDRLELLAASYACDYRDSPNKTNGIPDSYLVYSIAYDAFLDGYKAAMDQLADVDKVMNSSNNSNGWISVKERLPEEGEEVLVFGQYLNDIPKVLGVRSRYKGDQDWKYTWEGSDEWVYRENDVTHWMPLPKPPKEEK